MSGQTLSFVFKGKRYFEGDELPPLPQVDPPRPPHEVLPTMYDLPSEFPEEPGLPDEFHDLQPQLLSRTLHLSNYSRKNYFTASDLNVYYTLDHPLWHKRPDWFLAVGVPRMHRDNVLRRSYVSWQESSPPCVMVEFLSPGTEEGDLGRFYSEADAVTTGESAETRSRDSKNGKVTPPEKLEVYERYLRVPHYIVYSRHSRRLRYFKLVGGHYEEQELATGNCLIWLEDLAIGLGVWQGEFEDALDSWLRWCDQEGNWLLTDTEKEQDKAEEAQQQVVQAAKKLLATGMAFDQVVEVLSLTEEQIGLLELGK